MECFWFLVNWKLIIKIKFHIVCLLSYNHNKSFLFFLIKTILKFLYILKEYVFLCFIIAINLQDKLVLTKKNLFHLFM